MRLFHILNKKVRHELHELSQIQLLLNFHDCQYELAELKFNFKSKFKFIVLIEMKKPDLKSGFLV